MTDVSGNWRVGRGILAASLATVVMLPAAAFFMFLFDPDEGMSLFDMVGAGIVMLFYYGIIIVPAVLLGCAVIFGAMYFVLRRLGLLRPALFPLVTAGVVLVAALADSTPFHTWKLGDSVGLVLMLPCGALIGYVFARYAAPSTGSVTLPA